MFITSALVQQSLTGHFYECPSNYHASPGNDKTSLPGHLDGIKTGKLTRQILAFFPMYPKAPGDNIKIKGVLSHTREGYQVSREDLHGCDHCLLVISPHSGFYLIYIGPEQRKGELWFGLHFPGGSLKLPCQPGKSGKSENGTGCTISGEIYAGFNFRDCFKGS